RQLRVIVVPDVSQPADVVPDVVEKGIMAGFTTPHPVLVAAGQPKGVIPTGRGVVVGEQRGKHTPLCRQPLHWDQGCPSTGCCSIHLMQTDQRQFVTWLLFAWCNAAADILTDTWHQYLPPAPSGIAEQANTPIESPFMGRNQMQHRPDLRWHESTILDHIGGGKKEFQWWHTGRSAIHRIEQSGKNDLETGIAVDSVAISLLAAFQQHMHKGPGQRGAEIEAEYRNLDGAQGDFATQLVNGGIKLRKRAFKPSVYPRLQQSG